MNDFISINNTKFPLPKLLLRIANTSEYGKSIFCAWYYCLFFIASEMFDAILRFFVLCTETKERDITARCDHLLISSYKYGIYGTVLCLIDLLLLQNVHWQLLGKYLINFVYEDATRDSELAALCIGAVHLSICSSVRLSVCRQNAYTTRFSQN